MTTPVVALSVLAVSASGWLCAQTVSGSLAGTVTDPTPASVPDSRVTITETATGALRPPGSSETVIYVPLGLMPRGGRLQATIADPVTGRAFRAYIASAGPPDDGNEDDSFLAAVDKMKKRVVAVFLLGSMTVGVLALLLLESDLVVKIWRICFARRRMRKRLVLSVTRRPKPPRARHRRQDRAA